MKKHLLTCTSRLTRKGCKSTDMREQHPLDSVKRLEILLCNLCQTLRQSKLQRLQNNILIE